MYCWSLCAVIYILILRLRSYTTVSDRLFEESNKPSASVLRWAKICAEYDYVTWKQKCDVLHIWIMYLYIVYYWIAPFFARFAFFCADKLQEYQRSFLHAWCWISRPSLRSSRPYCSASASFMLLFRRAKSSENLVIFADQWLWGSTEVWSNRLEHSLWLHTGGANTMLWVGTISMETTKDHDSCFLVVTWCDIWSSPSLCISVIHMVYYATPKTPSKTCFSACSLFEAQDLAVCRQQLMLFVNKYKERVVVRVWSLHSYTFWKQLWNSTVFHETTWTSMDPPLIRFLQKQLSQDVPYKVLNFLGAQINYGGRVTDDKDKLLISTCLV